MRAQSVPRTVAPFLGVLLVAAGGISQTPTPIASLQPGPSVVIPPPPYYSRSIEPSQVLPLPPGIRQPAGVAWDGQALWVTDFAERKAWPLDPEGGAAPVPIDLPDLRSPGAVTIDPSADSLWIVDDPSHHPTGRTVPGSPGPLLAGVTPKRRIVRVSRSGQLNAAEIPITARADGLPVTDLAWDGEKLWLSTLGGMCSCLYRVDQDEDGRVMESIFPRCEPVGLTIDHEGHRLWMAADRGEGQRAVLLERILQADKVPMYRTQRLLVLIPEGIRPRGIAAAGRDLWVLDVPELDRRLSLRRGSEAPPPVNRLLRFRVR